MKTYTAAQIRAMDRHLIEVLGIPGYELMCRAGAAALDVFRELWPSARHMLVICGGGNNGGDGYVLARLAKASGLAARVMAAVDEKKLEGDAHRAYRDCAAAEVQVSGFDAGTLDQADVIVDALFGIGLNRLLDMQNVTCIHAINTSGKPVLALDIPSGLHADSGAIMGAAVTATATLCFIGMKLGCYEGEGPRYTGKLYLADLGSPKHPPMKIED